MRRADSMVWILASAAATVCAALTVSLADASEHQPVMLNFMPSMR